MRNVLAVFAGLLVVSCHGMSAAAFERSESASIGISGGPLFAITATPASLNAVYVATGAGVFKSVYGADIWTPVNTGLASTYVYDIVASDATGTTIYAATKDGVYKSTDAGEKWASAGLKGYQTYALAIHPITATYLAAGTAEGVFTSTNGGTAWTTKPQGPSYAYAVAYANSASATLYAGSFGEGAYRSTDLGATWSTTGSGPSFINHIAIDPSTTSTLYAGTSTGIFKSTNSGTVWSALSADFASVPVYDIAIPEGVAATLYAATDKGAYKSTSSGSSWAAINSGITSDSAQGPFVRANAVDPRTAATLYAGTYSGDIYDVDLYKSTDSGSSWRQLNRELANTTVYALAFDADDQASMYAGTSSIGVLKSTDSGLSWAESNEGLANYLVKAVTVNPDSSNIYAATSSGMFLSTDAGENWSAASPNYDIAAIAVDPQVPENVYLGTNSGIFLSTDDGETWIPKNNNLINPNITCLALHPTAAGTLYAGTKGDGIFKSSSGGASWTSASEGLDQLEIISLAIDQAEPTVLYAGPKAGGLYKTADSGTSWLPVPSDQFDGLSIHAIAVNPAGSEVLYVGVEGLGFFRSTDSGASWSAGSEDLAAKTVYDIVVNPEDSQTVHVAAQGQIAQFTFNSAPDAPADPVPADGAVNQPLELTLQWTGSDPDPGDTLSYKVYFGADPDPETGTPASVTAAAYTPAALALNTIYYWQVVAIDSQGMETAGEVWEFATSISNPPRAPAGPSPADGAEEQSILTELSWTGGDPDQGDAVVYDVYLGPSETPPLAKESVAETTYKPPRILAPLTTYYWKIVARDNNGLETEGGVWSFTTGLIPAECLAEEALGRRLQDAATLRRFRDQFLLQSEQGRALVKLYYLLSPQLAEAARRDQSLADETRNLICDALPLMQSALHTGQLRPSPEMMTRAQRLLARYARRLAPDHKGRLPKRPQP